MRKKSTTVSNSERISDNSEKTAIKKRKKQRSGCGETGVLLHITSLGGGQGIGALGKSARSFVDMLARSGQSYWQFLPINPTTYGDSPYQATSAFAGNPYFIDLYDLCDSGLLRQEEIVVADLDDGNCRVNFAKMFNVKNELLRRAFERFSPKTEGYAEFIADNADWLDDYSRFYAFKEMNGNIAFSKWEYGQKTRHPGALDWIDNYSECRRLQDYAKFTQFEFFRQFATLKEYANGKGIKLIGDIPFYVAYDSADVWAKPNLFMLDGDRNSKLVAGVPPDYFCATGQLWGNPIYDWDAMKADGYRWWLRRFEVLSKFCDVVRVDHFRAFESYYVIPNGAPNAINGEWRKGVGLEFFKALKKRLPKLEIIAEDLGILTRSARSFVTRVGFPKMKVLQFAFDYDQKNPYLNKNYDGKPCVAYTGTHDNMTLTQFCGYIDEKNRRYIIDIVKPETEDERLEESLIKYLMKSDAEIVVVPLQDYLFEGAESRMNTPGGTFGNWTYRVNEARLTSEVEKRIKRLSIRGGQSN